jgi:3-oxoacyl-[acyl-carrier protein] reductase
MALHGKVALVTGASRGIGRAIAIRLAQDGAAVIVNYNSNREAAESVVRDIEMNDGRALSVQADLSRMEEIDNLFTIIDSTFPHLDILINNAGAASFGPMTGVLQNDFEAQFNLNVRGLFFTTQAAVGRMNDNGRIINISSGITRVNAPAASVYAGTKAAVEAFTRCWAAELGPRGITVNTVSPGMTETDLLMQVTPPEVLENHVAQTPLGRLGQPADIADAVALLCSDDARWLTAQNVLANGGVG